jgi:predicted RNase H-like HicB family nuclease
VSNTLETNETSSQDTQSPPTTTRRSLGSVSFRTAANTEVMIRVEATPPVAQPVPDLPPDEPRYGGWPLGFLRQYAEAAGRHATVQETDDGVWIAYVVGLEGAWSEGSSYRDAKATLPETIVDWLIVKMRLGATDIPQIDGLSLKPL